MQYSIIKSSAMSFVSLVLVMILLSGFVLFTDADPEKPGGFIEEPFATGLDSPWGMAFCPMAGCWLLKK